MQKQKNISYTIKDYNGNELERGNYNLRVVETKTGKDLATAFIKKGENSILFIGNQNINKEWAISVDGGQYGSISISFTPSNTKHLDLVLNKIKQEIIVNTPIINNPRTYGINAGKHGDYINPTATSVNEAIHNVKAHFGWKIDRDNTERNFNNYPSSEITIKYKKAWNYFLTRWWFYVSTIILLLIVLLIPTISGNSEKDLVLQEIYGDKITIAQLNKYKADYCKTTDENQSKGFWGIIKKAFKHDDSQLCSTIDKALESLTCINDGNIGDYQKFTSGIQSKSYLIQESLNSYRNNKSVVDTLNKYFKAENLSNTTIDSLECYIVHLAKIAEYDLQISSLRTPENCNSRTVDIKQYRLNNRPYFTFYHNEVLNRLSNRKNELEQITAAQQQAEAERLAAEQQRIANETAAREKQIEDIKAYLRGNMLTKDRLKHDLDKHVSTNIDNSIKLCLEFWDVFNKDSVKTDDFSTNVSKLRAKVSADSNIGSSSELYKFLNTLCTDQSALEKIKSIRATAWSNINTLQHLIDKSK